MSKIKRFNKGWTSVPNELLNDDSISFKAKGLYAFLNSKPDEWDFSVDRIALQSKDGKDAVRNALQELQAKGWVLRTPAKNADGTFNGYDYWINDTPRKAKPSTGQPSSGNPSTVNPVTISNKENSKKEEVKKKQEERTASPFIEMKEDKKLVQSERDEIINLIKQLVPSLMEYPSIVKIIEAIEDKPTDQREGYIRFVIQTKKPSKLYEVRGWKDWFWADYYANERSSEEEGKVLVHTKEDLADFERLNLNPYGRGKWADQFKHNSNNLV